MTSCPDKSGKSGKDESAKSGKDRSAAYEVGYAKPPVHTRFRKGQSGNPGGRRAACPATERTKALLLEEAFRTVTVSKGDRTLALPAIQAVLRSQMELALRGDFDAQQFVVTTIQKLGR
jgi:hypothetical protein